MSFDIFCSDCLQKLKEIDSDSIDCIVTSPPYNKKGLSGGGKEVGNNIWKKFNIDYSAYNDDMDESEYQTWQIDVLNECFRVIKPTGSIFYNHKIRRFNCQAYYPDFIFKSNAKLYQIITWNRQNCCDMRSEYLYPTTELIFWFVKDKPKVFKNKLQKEFQKEIWDILPSRCNTHPATFPIQLPENCIKLATEENDVVLDPFMGIGTTGISAVKLKRSFIGIEIDLNYFNIAQQSLQNEVKEMNRKLF